MIYSVITAAHIVIYSMGYWPGDNPKMACEDAMQVMISNVPDKTAFETEVKEKDLRFGCVSVASRPVLGSTLIFKKANYD